MPITDTEALTRTIEHREIFHDEMLALMRRIMSGEMSPVMMAALLVGLRVKKETIGEITAAAQVMREFSNRVEVADRTHLVDIVGTGGDGSHTFNISTCSMFVAAAAGARVSKHGNRSVSSKSGSADVLEALGAAIGLTPSGDRALHRRHRHRLHVRAEPPSGDEECRAGAQGTRRAHDLQHPRPADQSGVGAEHPDGRVPPRPGRHPGARAAAPRRRACGGGLRPRRHGRGLARRGDDGRRIQGRRDHRIRGPSRGFRPDDGEQPRAAGGDTAAVEGDAARGARRPARPAARHRAAQRRRGAVRGQCRADDGRRHRTGARGDHQRARTCQADRSSSSAPRPWLERPDERHAAEDRRGQARRSRCGAAASRPGVAAARCRVAGRATRLHRRTAGA